jgi:hypothetical protein
MPFQLIIFGLFTDIFLTEMREKWKKKRSRRLRRKRRKMRARSSAYTPHTIAKHANDFLIPCRVNALTSVLAYVTSRSSVQTTLRSDEHGVRSIRHFFTPVLAPGMRLSYRLHVHCVPLGQGAHNYRLLDKCGRGCSMGRTNKCLDILSKSKLQLSSRLFVFE